MWKAMLETEKADGDKDVKSGLTHLVQFPLIKNDVRSRYSSWSDKDLLAWTCIGIYQGHSEEYWERMGKAPGTSRLGPDKGLSLHGPCEADVGIFNCFFAVPLLFFAVRWCCFLQGFLPLLSFWQLVMQSALLVLRCPLLLWVLSVIVPGISEPLFPLPHQARDRNPCGFPATSPYTWPIAKQLLENCIAETWKQHTKLAHLPENGNKKLQNNCHPKKYPNNFNETLVVSIMFSTWWVPPSRQTMADISRQLNDLSWCFSLYNDKSNLVGNSDA